MRGRARLRSTFAVAPARPTYGSGPGAPLTPPRGAAGSSGWPPVVDPDLDLGWVLPQIVARRGRARPSVGASPSTQGDQLAARAEHPVEDVARPTSARSCADARRRRRRRGRARRRGGRRRRTSPPLVGDGDARRPRRAGRGRHGDHVVLEAPARVVHGQRGQHLDGGPVGITATRTPPAARTPRPPRRPARCRRRWAGPRPLRVRAAGWPRPPRASTGGARAPRTTIAPHLARAGQRGRRPARRRPRRRRACSRPRPRSCATCSPKCVTLIRYGPAGTEPGLDRGADVVDVHVDVPQPVAADHDQRVAERPRARPAAAGRGVVGASSRYMTSKPGRPVSLVGVAACRHRAAAAGAARGGSRHRRARRSAARARRAARPGRARRRRRRRRGAAARQLLRRAGAAPRGRPRGRGRRATSTPVDAADAGVAAAAAAAAADGQDRALDRARRRRRSPPSAARRERLGGDRARRPTAAAAASTSPPRGSWLRMTPELPRAPSRAPRASARSVVPIVVVRRPGLDLLDGRLHREVEVGAGVAVGHGVDVERVDLLGRAQRPSRLAAGGWHGRRAASPPSTPARPSMGRRVVAVGVDRRRSGTLTRLPGTPVERASGAPRLPRAAISSFTPAGECRPWLPTATSAARGRASATASRTRTAAPRAAGTPTSSACARWSAGPPSGSTCAPRASRPARSPASPRFLPPSVSRHPASPHCSVLIME